MLYFQNTQCDINCLNKKVANSLTSVNTLLTGGFLQNLSKMFTSEFLELMNMLSYMGKGLCTCD